MRRFGLVLLVLGGFPLSAGAEGWRLAKDTAGFASDDGSFAGLWLACSPGGRARLAVATGATRLQADTDQTVVVSVDGTAFLHRMRAGLDAGRPVLARTLGPSEARDLAGTLARGRKAEVATPAGRFILPLKGSGKALQGFLATCR